MAELAGVADQTQNLLVDISSTRLSINTSTNGDGESLGAFLQQADGAQIASLA